MAHTDQTGTTHPDAADAVTSEGLEHIDHCDECKARMPWLSSNRTPSSR